MTRLLHRDLAPAIVLMLLGVWAFWQSLEMSTLGAVFPRLASIGIFAGGVALTLRALVLAPPVHLPQGELARPLLLLALLLTWALLLPVTGFVVTSLAAALLAMLLSRDERPTMKSALTQALMLAIVVGIVTVVFGQVLLVKLP